MIIRHTRPVLAILPSEVGPVMQPDPQTFLRYDETVRERALIIQQTYMIENIQVRCFLMGIGAMASIAALLVCEADRRRDYDRVHLLPGWTRELMLFDLPVYTSADLHRYHVSALVGYEFASFEPAKQDEIARIVNQWADP